MLSETVADHVSPVNSKLTSSHSLHMPVLYNKSKDCISVSDPIIDKLAVSFTLKDDTHQKTVLEDAKSLIGDDNSDLFFKRGIIRSKIGKSAAAFILHAPNPIGSLEGPWRRRSRAYVTIGGPGKASGRLEYNPAKWNPAQQRHLKWELSRLFLLDPGSTYDIPTWPCWPDVTFAKVVGQGRITKVHVAIDLFGYAMDDLAWWKSKTDRTVLCSKGALESIYLGTFSKENASKVCIYDKTEQMREYFKKDKTQLLAIVDNWVRVEARLRNPNIMVSCLGQLPNPLQGIYCAQPDIAFQLANYPPPTGRGPHKAAMCHAGVPEILATIPCAITRKKLSNALTESKPPLWDVAKLWKTRPGIPEIFLV